MNNTLQAQGANAQQRILWMAMFAQGVNGRRGLPYVLVGKPGAAKTSIVKQLAHKAGLAFEGVLGSLRSPVDFLGVPVPRQRALSEFDQHLAPDGDPSITYMHYAPAGFSIRAALAKRCLIMFDEANTSPPSVQAAMLRVLFEGVVGELQLPPECRMILAMNETRDAAGGWDIAPPMANRLGWLDWNEPTPQDFSDFLLSGGKTVAFNTDGTPKEDSTFDAAAQEAAVDAVWASHWAKAVGEVTGFLNKRGNLLLQMPKEGAGAQRAWPSPRSWEMATRAMAGSYTFGLSDKEREDATAAFVGAGAYGEFFTWRKENDLPDPEKLLDGAATFKHNKSRIDRTAAVLAGCTAIVTPETCPTRKERSERLWKLIETMTDDATDVCIPSVKALVNARLILGSQASYKVLAKMEPVMSAAGSSRN